MPTKAPRLASAFMMSGFLPGDLPQVIVVDPRVGMAAVHNADQTVLLRLFDVGDDRGDVRGRRRRQLELTGVARVDAVQVLMKEDVSVDRVRRKVLEDGADDRAPRKAHPVSRRRRLRGLRQQCRERPVWHETEAGCGAQELDDTPTSPSET